MKLFRKLFSAPRPSQNLRPIAPCTPDETVNIIGDIHGCSDLLDQLLSKLDPSEKIVTVGDYVDRGENSRQVLELLFARQTTSPDRYVCLMGNHEVMLLEFLDQPAERGGRWLRNGGLQTLASFGVTGVKEIMSPDEMIAASAQFREKLPKGLEDWIRQLPLTWTSGNLLVVHAAADPTIPPSGQGPRVLLWGHPEFLKRPRTDDIWVAHGHTVIEPPEQSMSRISVDTGAYHSGRLTAARCFPSGEVSFIQAVL